ncbi:ParA family protein [Amycolatopsis sp. NPDC051102]|uniref:ParA family protein n=1 Tax=Amycolatopsis sp. NPDC051102 TaxID=3155163 RepID=UPI0034418452
MTRSIPNISTSRAQARARLEAVRPYLKRVVLFINGKGGAGKTSLTANSSGTLARALSTANSSRRVLAIQLDHQGDLGLDVNTRYAEGLDDDGASIRATLMGNGSLKVIRDVRPNFDVVPSGSILTEVAGYLKSLDTKNRLEARLRFVEAVASLAHEYDWIFIDCPPGDQELQILGLLVARWFVIPVVFDKASLYGLEGVADALEEAEEFNTAVQWLGVVMFAFERKDVRTYVDAASGEVKTQEGGQRARIRKKLKMELERLEADPGVKVFKSVISYNRSIAEDCRDYGRLVVEAADAASHPDWRKERQRQQLSVFTSDAATGLAADYEQFTAELVSTIRAREADAARATENS